MTEESNPTEGPEDMTLADAIVRAESWAQNAGIRPAPEVTRNVVRVLASEIARLQEIVQKAKCRIPDDCIDSKRYPLFMAREVMKQLIDNLCVTTAVKPGALS